MAYSINPNLVKARRIALLLILRDKLPLNVVARKCGVHRSTLWRWTKKWEKLNENISQVHYGRPTRQTRFCPDYYSWTVNTLSSAPNTHPKRLPEWVEKRVVELRLAINRCAAIIQEYLSQESIKISLSSIKRIFKRHHLLRDKSKWKKYHRTLQRPMVDNPGDLVEVDTVHYANALNREHKYIITVIDIRTRLAYAKCFTSLIPSNSLIAILEQLLDAGKIAPEVGLNMIKKYQLLIDENTEYIKLNGVDMPEIDSWVWGKSGEADAVSVVEE